MRRPWGVFAFLAVFVLADSSAADSLLTGEFKVTTDGFSVRYPKGWTADYYANLPELRYAPPEQAEAGRSGWGGRVRICVDRRTDHADAIERLKDIMIDNRDPVSLSSLEIGGWPAIERRQIAGVAEPSLPRSNDDRNQLRLTTAIAAAKRVIRLETHLPPGAFDETAEKLATTVEAVGRSVRVWSATTTVEHWTAFCMKGHSTRATRNLSSREPLA